MNYVAQSRDLFRGYIVNSKKKLCTGDIVMIQNENNNGLLQILYETKECTALLFKKKYIKTMEKGAELWK